ncbi:MAG TPA: RluA family pseudouridine synthase, partial [Polyangiaceae bacterium]|nr:RluA family pseudouridine synthase [Polyangiaceae bacterium]
MPTPPTFDPNAPVESWPADSWLVPPEQDGASLAKAVRERMPFLSWNRARALIEQGKVRTSGEPCRESERRVTAGDTLEFVPKGRSDARDRGTGANDIRIVHRDSQVVVVEKPPGLSTVPFDDSERDSLDRRLASLLAHKGRPARLLVVHRLDKDTSGLLVFARTDSALKHLKNQFRFHTTARRYVALAHGAVQSRTIVSRLVQDRGDGLRGSTDHPELGREAITHVRLLERLGPISLIECRLETGRTHQIRIHLAEAGHPLVGERVYGRNHPEPLLAAPRLFLHAAELGFEHPNDGQRLHFESEIPAAFEEFMATYRPRSSKPAQQDHRPRLDASRQGSPQQGSFRPALQDRRPRQGSSQQDSPQQ